MSNYVIKKVNNTFEIWEKGKHGLCIENGIDTEAEAKTKLKAYDGDDKEAEAVENAADEAIDTLMNELGVDRGVARAKLAEYFK